MCLTACTGFNISKTVCTSGHVTFQEERTGFQRCPYYINQQDMHILEDAMFLITAVKSYSNNRVHHEKIHLRILVLHFGYDA